MDNKKIIEEIDIIVRAKVEEARKDIKKIVKETDSAMKTMSNSLNKIDAKSFDGMFSKLNTDELKTKIKELSSQKDALKEKFRLDNKLFSDEDAQNLDKLIFKLREARETISNNFENLNVDELKSALKIIEKEQNALFDNFRNKSKLFTDEDFKNMDEMASKIEVISEKLQNMGVPYEEINIHQKLPDKPKPKEKKYTFEDQLNDFDTKSIREQIGLVSVQIQQVFPNINKLSEEFKKQIEKAGSLMELLTSKFQPLKKVAKETINSVVKDFSNTKIASSFINTFESVKAKIIPLQSIFSNIGKIAHKSFSQASASIKEHSQKYTQPISKIKEFINKFKEARKESSKKSGTGFTDGLSKSFSNGIKSIKKFALSLLSVRTAFSMISKASQSYLSFNDQLSNSLQNSWNVLGSLLAPAIEYVINLFSKLVSVVANFVKALTGVDLVARANAKALDKQSKSASKASGSLSSIDDISVLHSESGSGSATQTLTVEDIDMTPFESFFAKVSELFSKIFEPFQLAWENVGTGVFDSMMSMVGSVGELGSTVGGSLFEVWTSGTGQEIIENCLLLWQQLFDIIGAVSGAISNAWQNAGTGTSIIQHIADIFKDIQKFALLIGDSLKQWVMSESFQEALNRVFSFIDDIFKIVKDICDWLLEMYEKYVKPVIDEKILPAINDIIIAISDIWRALKPVIDNAISTIKSYLEPVIQGLMGLIGGIIDVIRGIAQFISGVFTGDWKKAWNGVKLIFTGIWDAMWGALKGILNLIIAGFENMVNTVIKALNTLLTPLREMGNAVLEFLGVKSIKIPKIASVKLPRLASGDVAYEETAVVVGEYANARQNPEIISPKSMMEDSFRRVLNEKEESGTRVEKLIINVADENFYEGAIDYISSENVRKGVNVITEV